MNTKHIICIAITGAYIIGGCSEKTLSAGCDEHAAPKCIDNALYQCASSVDGTYWKKLDCDFGCFTDANNYGKCYECDPNDREKMNKCDYSTETKTSSIFECTAIPGSENNKGVWEQKQICLNGCTGDIGSSIYESTCKCTADCVIDGCNDDGSCKKVEKCTKHDITGSCASCKNGVGVDGTCLYPNCVLGEKGKLEDGECEVVPGCENSHDETGACICAEDVNHVLDGELIGTCECSDNCVAGCNTDGTCKPRNDCNSVDSNTGACICAEGINNIISNDENNGKCECHDTCKDNCNPDGSCKCENCATTCIFPSSVCQTARACVTDTDCFNYDYCKTAPCFCSNVDNQNGWEKNKCYLKDSNHNNMDDRYEDLALNRQDCSTNPNKNMMCTDGFCDSFIGYKCSTKCTDVTASNDVPVCLDGFTCRETDGRCAADSFTTVWSSEIRSKGVTFYGMPVSDISICWDWNDLDDKCAHNLEKVSADSKIIKFNHSYNEQPFPTDSNVVIKISGELDNFYIYYDLNIGKDKALSISNTLLEVRSFGQVGLGVPSKNLNCNRGDVELKFERGVGAFENCSNLTKVSDIDIPDSTKLSMDWIFLNTDKFNHPIELWDVSSIISMCSSFRTFRTGESPKGSFNQPLSKWDVSNVTTMEGLFQGQIDFNQTLENWDVSKVKSMHSMFAYSNYNKSLNNWNVSNVNTTDSMFADNTSFNQSLDNWTVSSINSATKMFKRASAFNQDISSWVLPPNIIINEMLEGTALYYYYLESTDNKPSTTFCKIYKTWEAKNYPVETIITQRVNCD